MRCFTAIVFPVACVDAISQHVQALDTQFRAAAIPAPSWERPSNLHCTLNFFGEIHEQQARCVTAATRAAVNPTMFPVRLRLQGLGVFPDALRPRVLWIGVEDLDGRLQRVQEVIGGVADKCGIPRTEHREFRPHVTIGRWRGVFPNNEEYCRKLSDARADFGEIEVGEVVMMQSAQSQDGVVYEPMARFPRAG